MNAALKSEDVRRKLAGAGLDPVGGTPEEFGRLIRSESEKWAPVIQRTGAKID
jgi:tripartite-type tricarboxylate transporter receptor subunit TctC